MKIKGLKRFISLLAVCTLLLAALPLTAGAEGEATLIFNSQKYYMSVGDEFTVSKLVTYTPEDEYSVQGGRFILKYDTSKLEYLDSASDLTSFISAKGVMADNSGAVASVSATEYSEANALTADKSCFISMRFRVTDSGTVTITENEAGFDFNVFKKSNNSITRLVMSGAVTDAAKADGIAVNYKTVISFNQSVQRTVRLTINGSTVAQMPAASTGAFVTEEEFAAALLNFDLESCLVDSLQYDYVISYDNYDPATNTCELSQNTAAYTLTVTSSLNDSPITQTKPYGQNFSYTTSNPDFKAWLDGECVVSRSKSFNYISTGDISVAESTENPAVNTNAYIPQPVRSIVRGSTVYAMVEIPVYFSGDISGYSEFGVLFVPEGTSEETAKNILNGTDTTGTSSKRSVAFDGVESNTVLTNKQRYIHKISAKSFNDGTFYAYIKIGGDYYISNARSITGFAPDALSEADEAEQWSSDNEFVGGDAGAAFGY